MVGFLKHWKNSSKIFFYITNPEVLLHDTGNFCLHGPWSKILWGTMCGIAGTTTDQNWNTLAGLCEAYNWHIGKYWSSAMGYFSRAEGFLYIRRLQLEFYLFHQSLAFKSKSIHRNPHLLNITNCAMHTWHLFLL